jgi:hypothetical protein
MLETTFAHFQTNPWPSNPVAQRTLNLAAEIATASDDPEIATRLYHALEKPFAVYNSDSLRRDTLLRLAVMLDHAGQANYCLSQIESAEPFVPWNFEFLRLRETVYTAARHPLASTAGQDLEAFLQGEGGLHRKAPPPLQVKRVASVTQ